MALVEKGAALMIEENTITETFESVFETLATDSHAQKTMGKKLKAMAKPNATARIADEIISLLAP